MEILRIGIADDEKGVIVPAEPAAKLPWRQIDAILQNGRQRKRRRHRPRRPGEVLHDSSIAGVVGRLCFKLDDIDIGRMSGEGKGRARIVFLEVMSDRANDAEFVGMVSKSRQMFAKLNAGDVGLNGLELTAD